MIRYLNGEQVAVKKVEPGNITDMNKFKTRLLREIYFGFKLEHDNLVKILGIYYPPELSEEERMNVLPHIVMEYGGENLDNYLKRQGSRVDWKNKKKIILEIAKGLKYLHERNLVHRDLKVDFYLLSNS